MFGEGCCCFDLFFEFVVELVGFDNIGGEEIYFVGECYVCVG